MAGGADSGYYLDALGRRFPLVRPARPAESVEDGPPPSAPQDAAPDYKSMTRPELQRAAREAGHRVRRTHTREDLIALLTGGE